ncbi:MAG: hypothetical protein J6C96_00550 [Oscillospiraceae bacterium]|nr:hypothetical protein [Oscillospiraceae bacterium]
MNNFKCKFLYSTEKRDKHESYCNFPSCRTDCLCYGRCLFCEHYKTGFCTNCIYFVSDNKNKGYKQPCSMCVNAKVDDELTDENDFSSISVGESAQGCRMSINSGNGRPVCIEVEEWDDNSHQNVVIASYYPKYCPNCGRELLEYSEI